MSDNSNNNQWEDFDRSLADDIHRQLKASFDDLMLNQWIPNPAPGRWKQERFAAGGRVDFRSLYSTPEDDPI